MKSQKHRKEVKLPSISLVTELVPEFSHENPRPFSNEQILAIASRMNEAREKKEKPGHCLFGNNKDKSEAILWKLIKDHEINFHLSFLCSEKILDLKIGSKIISGREISEQEKNLHVKPAIETYCLSKKKINRSLDDFNPDLRKWVDSNSNLYGLAQSKPFEVIDVQDLFLLLEQIDCINEGTIPSQEKPPKKHDVVDLFMHLMTRKNYLIKVEKDDYASYKDRDRARELLKMINETSPASIKKKGKGKSPAVQNRTRRSPGFNIMNTAPLKEATREGRKTSSNKKRSVNIKNKKGRFDDIDFPVLNKTGTNGFEMG